MKAIYVFLAAFAAFFTMLLAFTWLSGVSDADVYAFHDTDFDTEIPLLAPGAIVALSDSGEITRICSLKKGGIASGVPTRQVPKTGLYYNKLAENLPAFVGVVDTIKTTFGLSVMAGSVEAADDTKVLQAGFVPKVARVFKGEPSDMGNIPEYDHMDEPDCEKRITERLSKGYRACTVYRVLNEVVQDQDGRPVLDNETGTYALRTVAITFLDDGHFMMMSAFESFGVEYNERAEKANGARCSGSSLPWSARFRKFLEVIGRVDARA